MEACKHLKNRIWFAFLRGHSGWYLEEVLQERKKEVLEVQECDYGSLD